jgi:hypothetical protein
MRRVAAVLLLCMIAAPVATAQTPKKADEPFDFRGIRLGITLSEFKAAPPLATPISADYDVYTRCWEIKPKDVFQCVWWMQDRGVAPGSGGGYNASVDVAGRSSKDHSFAFIAKPGDPEPRLFWMTFKMESSDYLYGVLVDGLARRFGKPRIESEVVQNAFGARFNNEIRSWGNSKSNVSTLRFADDLDTTELRYILINHYRHYEKRLAEDRAKSPPKL